MKQKQTLAIFFLLLGLCSYSQKKRTIDWQKLDDINQSSITSPVRNGEFAIFKIKNINRFLYQVSVSGNSIDMQTEMPDELKKLFRISTVQETKQKKNENLEESVEKVEEAVAKMEEEDAKILTPAGLFTAADVIKVDASLSNIVAECTAYLDDAKAFSDKIAKAKFDKFELINLAQQDISFTKMQSKVSALNVIDNPKQDYDDLEEKHKALKKLYDQLNREATNAPAPTKANIQKALDLIEESYKKIESESDDFMTLYKEIKYLSDELVNENNFIVVSPPIQMIDDFINFQVDANPIITNSLAPHNSRTQFSFDVASSSGVEVDFSVGPTVSFGHNAKDDKYFLQANTENPGHSFLRERDNNNSGSPGLAAFMHVYDRATTQAAFGGLFGIGAGFQDIEDVDLSFYLGGTAVLGKKQKVMVNLGLSFLRVDRLKNKQYEEGKEYLTDDIDINDVVEKVFKSSLFFSVSYNISKRVE